MAALLDEKNSKPSDIIMTDPAGPSALTESQQAALWGEESEDLQTVHQTQQTNQDGKVDIPPSNSTSQETVVENWEAISE